ncbi:MAG: hypothetical protein RLZZ292_546 [Bacteroidota bacterium]|jgi:N utilization substance protein B
MLSRRIVRVKVMQLLYTMNRDESLTLKETLDRYRDSISKVYELYLFNLNQFLKVAEYATKDAILRSTKLRPTDEDRFFTPKLYNNPLIESLVDHKGFHSLLKKFNLETRTDDDQIRRLYSDFAKTKEYKAYVALEETTDEDHLEALLTLYRFLCSSSLFNEMMEDYHFMWSDDKSLVLGATKKTIKSLPTTAAFYEEHLPDPEVTTEFGENLLLKTHNRDEDLLSVIEPNLNNWDADRVAVIDMILIKMALCEMLEFKTIPTKVTLNEFVEISKQYSTEKSKEFINGILDKMMKELLELGKIVKEGRGLIE